jgi:hypothetical protein
VTLDSYAALARPATHASARSHCLSTLKYAADTRPDYERKWQAIGSPSSTLPSPTATFLSLSQIYLGAANI